MKRRDFERHLTAHGCRQMREGAKHTHWENAATGGRSHVPRHRELDVGLVRAICRQLGVPPPAGR